MKLITISDYARHHNISHRRAYREMLELADLGFYKIVIPKHNKKVKVYFIKNEG